MKLTRRKFIETTAGAAAMAVPVVAAGAALFRPQYDFKAIKAIIDREVHEAYDRAIYDAISYGTGVTYTDLNYEPVHIHIDKYSANIPEGSESRP